MEFFNVLPGFYGAIGELGIETERHHQCLKNMGMSSSFILQVDPVNLSEANKTNVPFVPVFRKHAKKDKHKAKH